MALESRMTSRWCKRHRVFVVISFLILTAQVFLFFNFFNISSYDEEKEKVSLKVGRNFEADLPRRQVVFPVDDDLADDEDSPSNTIDRHSSKGGNIRQSNSNGGAAVAYKGEAMLGGVVPNHSEEHFKVANIGNLTLTDKGATRSSSSRTSNNADEASTTARLNLDELDFKPQCDISSKDAVSAISRARTQLCKEEIANVSCLMQNGLLYPARLPRFCPSKGRKYSDHLGCFQDQQSSRLLTGHVSKLVDNSPSKCLDLCLQSGFQFAGVQYSYECFCGDDVPSTKAKLPEASCDLKCAGNPKLTCGGYFTMDIYSTGLPKSIRPEVLTKPEPGAIPIRVLFILTLNGRAVRQVRRLIKTLYHVRNYFYIHVDSRQDYLYRELLTLESKFGNIRLARRRYSTIWGGASLLQMLLQCMEDALKMTHWRWDFFINLSESDFPIKTNENLVNFLTANRDRNFVKSYGRDTQRFIGKQGLDKTFYECDTHMWRVGDRQLPWGVRVDGGSDWIALSRGFCSYLVNSKDELVTGLKTVYKYTLLPAESFFHTVIRNSEFCNTFVDNNLHVTNWKRKIGCRCQYQHIVDWCGCSPNDFKPDDWIRIKSTEERPYFFARKFEPIINQQIIDQVESWLYGPVDQDTPGLTSYWQNVYHSLDSSPRPDDAFLTMYHSFSRLSIRLLKQVEEKCKIVPSRVKEASFYSDRDVYKGTVVFFEATIGRNKQLATFETQARPRHFFTISKNVGPAGSRIKLLQVGTNYDQKEQLFRNFESVISPFSDPSLLHKWGPGDALAATVIWIDPANSVAGSYEVKVEVGPQISLHKPTFRQPLRPGIWTVKLMYQWNSVAETKFLVTPLSFMNGVEISADHVRFIHNGPGRPYVDHNVSMVEKFLGLHRRESAVRQAGANALRFGKDLLDWVDSLASQFYVIQDTCAVNKDTSCPSLELDECSSVSWSSLSPDPKSEIGGTDEKTGRLIR